MKALRARTEAGDQEAQSQLAERKQYQVSGVCSCCKLYDIEIVGYHRICHWSNMWSFI